MEIEFCLDQISAAKLGKADWEHKLLIFIEFSCGDNTLLTDMEIALVIFSSSTIAIRIEAIFF